MYVCVCVYACVWLVCVCVHFSFRDGLSETDLKGKQTETIEELVRGRWSAGLV